MLKIEKRKNDHGYDDIYINTDNGVFEITFQNNLDLYWIFIPNRNILEAPDTQEINITKENYYLYTLFENLYNSIKNSNPYEGYTFFKKVNIYEKDEIENSFNINTYPNNLCNNNIIIWCSDDYSLLENASSFKIEAKDEIYKITFKKGKPEHDSSNYFVNYTVRIRNSGSRYNPYNIAFMKMYQDLKEYDPDYHQIHIEEYLYEQKKLTKTKNEIL